MEYRVLKDHHLQEFDLDLYEGEILNEQELEPDVWGNLISLGVVEDAQAKPKSGKAKK